MSLNKETAIDNIVDISIYKEVAERIEAKVILDIGLFWKRTGSISSVANINENLKLNGIDITKWEMVNAYMSIYDNIEMLSDFLNSLEASKDENVVTNQKYDMVTMFRLTNLIGFAEYEKILKWCVAHTKCILTDEETLKDFESVDFVIDSIKDLYIDDNKYYLLIV